jgi:hypothetical protein
MSRHATYLLYFFSFLLVNLNVFSSEYLEYNFEDTNAKLDFKNLSDPEEKNSVKIQKDKDGNGILRLAPCRKKKVRLQKCYSLVPYCKLKISLRYRTSWPASNQNKSKLYLELNSKNGTWLAGGFYDDLKGTKGKWCEKTKTVMIPGFAGMVSIGIQFSGEGILDVDYLRIKVIRDAVVLRTPQSDSDIIDSRPVFTWERHNFSDTYLLELKGPDNIKKLVQGNHFRPQKNLKNGNYSWRVEPVGGKFSPRADFTLKAKDSADTSGPDIQDFTGSITETTDFIKLKAFDKSGLVPAKTQVFIDGYKTRYEIKVRDSWLEIRPKYGWSLGAHRVAIKVFDKAGNSNIRESIIVCAPAPKTGAVNWTPNRGVTIGGEKFWPMIIYQVDIAEMPKVAKMGMNTIHHYDFEHGYGLNQTAKYLEAAEQNNLKVFLGFDRGKNGTCGIIQANLFKIAQKVALARSKSSLLAWYLFDEPDLVHQAVSPERMRELYLFLKKIDPYHPVIVSLYAGSLIKTYGKCYDIFWPQYYGNSEFVFNKGKEWQQYYDTQKDMKIMILLRTKDKENAGCFDSQIAQVLCGNSSGIGFWWYPDIKNKLDLREKFKSAIARLKPVIPFLTEKGENIKQSFYVTPMNAKVNVRLKKLSPKKFLMILSNSDLKQTAEVSIRLPFETVKMSPMVSGGTPTLINSTFKEKLPPNCGRYYLLQSK